MTSQRPVRPVPAAVPEGLEDVYLEFLVEASEILSRMDTDVVELEKGTAGPEVLEAVFRGMHTLKGAAGFLNLTAVQEVSHRAEDDLSRMREEGIRPALLVSVLECLDELRVLIVGEGSRPTSPAVRVSGETLDRLLELSGEMASHRRDLAGLLRASGRGPTDPVGGIVSAVDEVHRTVLRARVQPVDEAFGRLPRVVRDASSQVGKKVELAIRGRDVEIDRGLLEPLGDVLVHLLRNAVDHGVEPPEVRRASGKPETANVVVRAHHSTDGVVIDVSDDGGGVDVEKVRSTAIDRGLLEASRAQSLTEGEIVELLFLPGFSTAASVGMLSGRGVGMDVVRTTVEEHGGSVTIESRKGVGTKVSIRLPSTLLGMPVVLFEVGRYRCMLPRGIVEKVVSPDEILSVGNGSAYSWGRTLVPVLDLGKALSAERSLGPGLLCRVGNGLVVFQVATLNGNTETLVRPVDKLLRGQAVYAGMSLTENARPALLLDPAGLLRRCGVVVASDHSSEHKEVSAGPTSVVANRSLVASFRGVLHAIPEHAILGVFRDPPLTAVPSRPGFFVLADEVLHVLHPDGTPATSPRCLVRLEGNRRALAVESVQGVRDTSSTVSDADVVVVRSGEDIIEVLDPDRVFAEVSDRRGRP